MATTVVNPFRLNEDEVYHALGAPGVKRILAEGDSWMSLFLPDEGNLLSHLRTEEDCVILDLSYPGDTLAEMASGEQFELFRRLTGDPLHGYEFELILLLGGGNDLIGHGLESVVVEQRGAPTSVRGCLDENRLRAVLAGIEGDLEKFIAALDAGALNRATPVLTCTYDYVTPRDAGASLLGATLKGPWIYPVMRRKGIHDPKLQKAITDRLLERYRQRLAGLATRHEGRFFVVDTLGTLAPAIPDEAESADWADEIHPTANGWRKLARKLEPEIDRLLAS